MSRQATIPPASKGLENDSPEGIAHPHRPLPHFEHSLASLRGRAWTFIHASGNFLDSNFQEAKFTKAVEEHYRWHHEFWLRSNSSFNRGLEEAEDKDKFYRDYLLRNWAEFQRYHLESWKRNVTLLAHYFKFASWSMLTGLGYRQQRIMPQNGWRQRWFTAER